MALLSLLFAALAMPLAAMICFAVQGVARRLGHGPSAERVTAADRRWLAAQHADLPR